MIETGKWFKSGFMSRTRHSYHVNILSLENAGQQILLSTEWCTVGRLIRALWHLAFLLVWAPMPCKYSSISLNLIKYDIFNNSGPSILKKFRFFKNLPLCVTQKTSFLTSKFAIFWKIVPFFLYFEIFLNGSFSCMI